LNDQNAPPYDLLKIVAKLQAEGTQDGPYLLLLLRDSGHGGDMGWPVRRRCSSVSCYYSGTRDMAVTARWWYVSSKTSMSSAFTAGRSTSYRSHRRWLAQWRRTRS